MSENPHMYRVTLNIGGVLAESPETAVADVIESAGTYIYHVIDEAGTDTAVDAEDLEL